MKRHGFLIIGIACLFGFILCLATLARAETNIYATVIGQGAGYDTGFGLAVDHTTARYADIFALHAEGKAALRKKHNASDGYTYGASAQLRAYLSPVYAAVGYGIAGYRSEFDSGAVWEKSAWQPHVELGYEHTFMDLWARYYLEESDTPNKVSAFTLGSSWRIWQSMKLLLEAETIMFHQAGDQLNDTVFTVGLGWEF